MTKQADIGLSEMVKEMRAQLGLTQEQFAAKVSVTWSTVNRWENGRGKPSPLALGHVIEIVQEAGGVDAKIKECFVKMRVSK
jgi:DNA-binding transcriptional regulator YiaG